MNIVYPFLKGLISITPQQYEDERGCFWESFQDIRYGEIIKEKFVQDNISISKRGVIRGLHLQNSPNAQGKLVSVLRGAVLDVVVDVRTESPTFGQHFQIELNDTNRTQLYIPPGFAHGFQALEDQSIFSYKCTNYYSSNAEVTILWNDSVLNIKWPLDVQIVSEKDQKGITFSEFNSPF